MPASGETTAVEARPAPEVEDRHRATAQDGLVDPGDLAVDRRRAPRGGVVRLRKVLGEHPGAERRIVPGDVVAFGPRLRRGLAIHQIGKVHPRPSGDAGRPTTERARLVTVPFPAG
jgi:hypothetical protein